VRTAPIRLHNHAPVPGRLSAVVDQPVADVFDQQA
jgi:hypothetical protein